MLLMMKKFIYNISDNKSRRKKEHVEAGRENGDELLRWSERVDNTHLDDSVGNRS